MNEILKTLEQVVALLNKEGFLFAVAGGIVANIYRGEIRTTNDIDLLFYTKDPIEASARRILESLGLTVGLVREHQLTQRPAMNKKRSPYMIAVGRNKSSPETLGVDLLLPSFPWFENAMSRAQNHLLDFGFSRLPSVTIEDLILMKVFAARAKDVDDLESIFRSKHQLDLDYIEREMKRLSWRLPLEAAKVAPKRLVKINK